MKSNETSIAVISTHAEEAAELEIDVEEIVMDMDIPSPPSYFNRYSKKFYNTMASILVDNKKMKEQDYPAFITLCMSWGIYEEMARKIQTEGMHTVDAKGNIVENAYYMTMRHASADLKNGYYQFGISPYYATKIKQEMVHTARKANSGIRHLFQNNA